MTSSIDRTKRSSDLARSAADLQRDHGKHAHEFARRMIRRSHRAGDTGSAAEWRAVADMLGRLEHA